MNWLSHTHSLISNRSRIWGISSTIYAVHLILLIHSTRTHIQMFKKKRTKQTLFDALGWIRCKTAQKSGKSQTNSAPKFVNQFTQLHGKTMRTRLTRPFSLRKTIWVSAVIKILELICPFLLCRAKTQTWFSNGIRFCITIDRQSAAINTFTGTCSVT